MTRALLVALLALAVAVAAMVVALTRHENPRTKLETFSFPPPLNSVTLGATTSQVRRIMGPPEAVHHYKVPPEVCWDYVFPTNRPHYRLCFTRGRLVMRTPF